MVKSEKFCAWLRRSHWRVKSDSRLAESLLSPCPRACSIRRDSLSYVVTRQREVASVACGGCRRTSPRTAAQGLFHGALHKNSSLTNHFVCVGTGQSCTRSRTSRQPRRTTGGHQAYAWSEYLKEHHFKQRTKAAKVSTKRSRRQTSSRPGQRRREDTQVSLTLDQKFLENLEAMTTTVEHTDCGLGE